MSQKNGMFIISLDMELFWGMHDVMQLQQYKQHLLGTPEAVSGILELFDAHNIHATWAIVGMLYFRDRKALHQSLPVHLPSYKEQKQSAYYYMRQHPIKKEEEPLFFAPDLIDKITQTNHQEIATHTFSHLYTLEDGIHAKSFKADLEAALIKAKEKKHSITSIIFPRNQINEDFLKICRQYGISTYRGTEKSFIYRNGSNDRRNYFIRGLRLLDHYVNLFGHQTYRMPTEIKSMYNLPSSRFLLPYHRSRKWLEPLKLRRIKRAMTYAAKHREVYHLWWHPHNFGKHLPANLDALKQILQHYNDLQRAYQFQSVTMREVTKMHTTTYKGEENNGYSMDEIFIYD